VSVSVRVVLDLSRNHGARHRGYLAGRTRAGTDAFGHIVVLSRCARGERRGGLRRKDGERERVRYVFVFAEKPTFVEIKKKLSVREVKWTGDGVIDTTGTEQQRPLAGSGRGLDLAVAALAGVERTETTSNLFV